MSSASRIVQVCSPGQAIPSEAVHAHLGEIPPRASISELGVHYLRDLEEPEKFYQLTIPTLRGMNSPPLATLNNHLTTLLTSLAHSLAASPR